ncbi:MAG TPA: hypothetical protein VF710_16090 [Longimicrobium sp.]|jgi:hypothetical protein
MLRCWLLLALLLFGWRPLPTAGEAACAGCPAEERPEHVLYADTGLPDEAARAEAGAELVVHDGARSRRHPPTHPLPVYAAPVADVRAAHSPDPHASAFSLPGGGLPYYATAPPGLPG